MTKKIKTIVIDTLNGLQNDQWMAMQKKAANDDWFDFSKDIYNFIVELTKLGFEIVLVPGYEGTGKSYGMKTLEPGTNIWYNCDNKNPTWEGGRGEYGTKQNPTKYQIVPEDYNEILEHIKAGQEAGGFDEKVIPVAYLLCHIEEFKSGNETRQRMKTLGKMASKMNIEGKMEHVYYTQVKKEGGKVTYNLLTQNTGLNSGRSPEGLFKDERIPNDYNLIFNAIQAYK
jgi:hypothetical protein